MVDYWKGMENDPQTNARIKRAIDIAKVEDRMIVFDVGCYKMQLLKLLGNRVNYFGIDKQHYCNGVSVMDIDGGFTVHGKADRVFCLEVLEHLVYPNGTLASISACLNSQGLAVISLPNENTVWHRLRLLVGRCDNACWSESGKHLHLPSLAQSRKFLHQYFEIVRWCPYIVLPTTISPRLRRLLLPILEWLSWRIPSLFARGFIFVCRNNHLM